MSVSASKFQTCIVSVSYRYLIFRPGKYQYRIRIKKGYWRPLVQVQFLSNELNLNWTFWTLYSSDWVSHLWTLSGDMLVSSGWKVFFRTTVPLRMTRMTIGLLCPFFTVQSNICGLPKRIWNNWKVPPWDWVLVFRWSVLKKPALLSYLMFVKLHMLEVRTSNFTLNI